MRKSIPALLVLLSAFAAAGVAQVRPDTRPSVPAASPTTISVIDLSGAAAHNVIVLIDGQPYNAVARPPIDPPSPFDPTPVPPGPLPPPAPPNPNPPVPPGPPKPPDITPIDPATHIFVTYVSAWDSTDQAVRALATSQTIDAALKSSLNAEWTSLDTITNGDVLQSRRLSTYVAGTGLPCVVVQDDKGNVYDEKGHKIDPAVDKLHAIPAPATEQGVIDLIKAMRGK